LIRCQILKQLNGFERDYFFDDVEFGHLGENTVEVMLTLP
jgi:hypothetical protein